MITLVNNCNDRFKLVEISKCSITQRTLNCKINRNFNCIANTNRILVTFNTLIKSMNLIVLIISPIHYSSALNRISFFKASESCYIKFIYARNSYSLLYSKINRRCFRISFTKCNSNNFYCIFYKKSLCQNIYIFKYKYMKKNTLNRVQKMFSLSLDFGITHGSLFLKNPNKYGTLKYFNNYLIFEKYI